VRAVRNSVLLYHAIKAGLDAAIVNPLHITPYAESDAEQHQLDEDLIYNRPDALPRYIAYFESHEPQSEDSNTKVDPTEGMNAAERIHWQILHRRKEGIEPLIDQIIEERAEELSTPKSEAAVNVLNTVLLPAMKDVGDRFGAGELILPFVLQSAEVMKRAVAHLEMEAVAERARRRCPRERDRRERGAARRLLRNPSVSGARRALRGRERSRRRWGRRRR